MTVITSKLIKKEMQTNRLIAVGVGCLCVALIFVILPLLKVDTRDPNFQFNITFAAIFLLAIIGIPIGGIFGIRYIIKGIKMNGIIDSRQYRIETDEIDSLYYVGTGKAGEDSGTNYYFAMKKYTKKTGKNISFRRQEGKKIKKGDKYYLLYSLKKDKYMVCFPVDEYLPEENIRID